MWHVLEIQNAFYLDEKEEITVQDSFHNTVPTLNKNKIKLNLNNNNFSNDICASSHVKFSSAYNCVSFRSEKRNKDINKDNLYDNEEENITNNILTELNNIENGVVDNEIGTYSPYRLTILNNEYNRRDSDPLNNINKFHNNKTFNIKSNNEINNNNSSLLNSLIKPNYNNNTNNAPAKNHFNNLMKTETINNSNSKVNNFFNKNNNINNEKIISNSPNRFNDKFINGNNNKNLTFTNNNLNNITKTPIKIANGNYNSDFNLLRNQIKNNNNIQLTDDQIYANKNENAFIIDRNLNNSNRKQSVENFITKNNQKIISYEEFPFSETVKINKTTNSEKMNLWSNENNIIFNNGVLKNESKTSLNFDSSKTIVKDFSNTNFELDYSNADSNINENNFDLTQNSYLISKSNYEDSLDKARFINTSCSMYDSNNNVKLSLEKDEIINTLGDHFDFDLNYKNSSNINLILSNPIINQKIIINKSEKEEEEASSANKINFNTKNDSFDKSNQYPYRNISFSLKKAENLNLYKNENLINRKLINSKIFTFLKWKRIKATSLPNPRNAHSTTVINKYIFIFGGHFKNLHLNDLIILDTFSNCWLIPNLSGNIPSGLRGHTSSAIFNNFYIFGGYDGKNRVNDLFRFSLEDFNFIKIPNNRELIFPRQRHTANVYKDKIYFFGGFEGNKWINNLDILNVDQLENNLLKENFKRTIKSDFGLILNSKEHSDLTFVVENKEIYAHKALLCVRVEYFQNMFSEHMLEKDFQIVEIFEYAYEIFFEFLAFVYSSEINKKSFEVIKELFRLSDNYSYDPLKKYVETALSLMLELHNVIEILINGYKCNSILLEKVCIDFIFENRKNSILLNEIKNLIEYPNLMTKILRTLANA